MFNLKLLYMEINLANKVVQHQMGTPFWPYACWFRISITEEDIDYLINVIQKDKLYPLIKNSFFIDTEVKPNEYSKLQICYAKINQIVFYDTFYNDAKCPKGIKLILFTYLGLLRDYVNETNPNLLSKRYLYIEQWFNSIKNNT